MTDAQHEAVVLERYWITFQSGEIRVCTSCHGPSHFDQAGQAAPENPPQALLALLEYWQAHSAVPYGHVYLPVTRKNMP